MGHVHLKLYILIQNLLGKDIKLSALGICTDKIKPTILRVYADNAKLNILGFYYINGRISNEGSVTATDSGIVATYMIKTAR